MADINPQQLPPPLAWQVQLLRQPASSWVALLGGRYSGKSWCLCLLALKSMAPALQGGHGAAFRGAILRSDLAGLQKLQQLMEALIKVAFGKGAKWSQSNRTWSLPTGGSLLFQQIGDDSSSAKFQGADYSFIAIDDAGLIDPNLVRRVITSLRSADATISPRLVVSANPGNRHSALWARLLSEAPAGKPISFSSREFSGRPWVVSLSNIFDNTALTDSQRDDYIQALKARANGNKSIEEAEIFGRWDSPAGGFFASLDSAKIKVPDGFHSSPARLAWQGQLYPQIKAEHCWLSMDWGGGMAPVWCGLAVQLQEPITLDYGLYLERDSLVILDEIHTARQSLNGQIDVERSTGLSDTRTVSRDVWRMVRSWGLDPLSIPQNQRIIDSAAGARTGSIAGSIAQELAAEGLSWSASPKGERAPGWSLLTKLFNSAGERIPSLYMSERCVYGWATLPTLQTHPHRLDDLAGPDHAADALRYLAVATFGRLGRSASAGFPVY